ncbi:hypothetical protein OHB41_46155 [Streptomyces sp. NBC_01571]|uniref:hypothetical protein n=1 Tax=Streptomyces sp. NBC_01571 TaxID=2975883 RepID=UPI002251F279|nr:hypothetical protein [Streptomyces sp. NBC_01571]MCX4580418.1 hypothetical protein [Streptomyces sp. NBC_01571]
MAAVHAAGVVHRDVKRGNVILAPDGPWVPDFGIAHALDSTPDTPTGVMTGTAGRISPQGYRTGAAGPAGQCTVLIAAQTTQVPQPGAEAPNLS